MSPVQTKEPYGNLDMVILIGVHPATRSVQSTPADNTRKRVWQYIEKEIKKYMVGRNQTMQKTEIRIFFSYSNSCNALTIQDLIYVAVPFVCLFT